MVRSAPERTKVVVRKLPPTLSEEHFKAAVDEVCVGQYTWFSYVQGKYGRKSIRHSRAYLNFVDALQVYEFRAKFDGHTFVSERGVQFSCSVEYAPYQKVPKISSKKDPKEGTLEKDVEYQEFLKTLENDVHRASGRAPASQPAPEEASGKPVTSLMQYLQDKWEGRIAAPASKSQKRQKAAQEEVLAPPPGFAPLAKSGSKPQRAGEKAASKQAEKVASKQDKAKGKQKAAQAQEQLAASAGGSQGSGDKKKGAKKKSQAKEAAGSSKAAPAAVEAPIRILKKESAPPEPREPEAQAEQTEPDQAGVHEASARKPARPVRVRAGFQVYTPRIRSDGGAASSEQPATAKPPSTSAAEQKAGEDGRSSRFRGGGKRTSGKAKPALGQEQHAESSKLSEAEGSGTGQQSGAQVSSMDADFVANQVLEWEKPAGGTQVPSNLLGSTATAEGALKSSEGGYAQSSRGRGRAGGRRHWRAKSETGS